MKRRINNEKNKTKWFNIFELKKETNIDEEIKIKVENLYNNYKGKV